MTEADIPSIEGILIPPRTLFIVLRINAPHDVDLTAWPAHFDDAKGLQAAHDNL